VNAGRVHACASARELAAQASLVVSAVTASNALAVARDVAQGITATSPWQDYADGLLAARDKAPESDNRN
jgi:hypothetical protein